MKTYDTVDDLIATLDRYEARLLGQPGGRLLIQLPRFLEVLDGDPRSESVVSDLRDAAVAMRADFGTFDTTILNDVAEVWRKEKALFEAAAAAADARGERETFDAFIGYTVFEDALQPIPSVDFTVPRELSEDPGRSSNVIDTLNHWADWLAPADKTRIRRELQPLKERSDFNYRRLWFGSRAAGGAAYQRLRTRADWLNLDPASRDLDLPSRQAIRGYWRPIIDGLLDSHNMDAAGRAMLAKEASATRRDIKLLHVDICGALLSRRSNLALIRRFQARCERFDAAELRTLAARDPGVAEAALTLTFARFLFDAGLDPFVDPTVAGLRPDILAPLSKTPIYVEAKQYEKQEGLNRMIRKAVRQVFDTWGKLRATHQLDEAFLAVFRRGGPRIGFPAVVRIDGRTLYTILIDLAEPADSGSQQKDTPVRVTEKDLVAWVTGAEE